MTNRTEKDKNDYKMMKLQPLYILDYTPSMSFSSSPFLHYPTPLDAPLLLPLTLSSQQ